MASTVIPLTSEEEEALAFMFRQNPLFKEVLSSYAQCLRPVSHDILPLNQSEAVLFDEFATGINMDPAHAPKNLTGVCATVDFRTQTQRINQFLSQALVVLRHEQLQVAHLAEIRDDALSRYLKLADQSWNWDRFRVRSTWADVLGTIPSGDYAISQSSQHSSSAARQPYKKADRIANDPLIQAKKIMPLTEEQDEFRGIRKRRENLSPDAVKVLHEWFVQHLQRPYPLESEKVLLAAEAKISLRQVGHWFVNVRKRSWLKMLQEVYGEEKAMEIYGPNHHNQSEVNVMRAVQKKRKAEEVAAEAAKAGAGAAAAAGVGAGAAGAGGAVAPRSESTDDAQQLPTTGAAPAGLPLPTVPGGVRNAPPNIVAMNQAGMTSALANAAAASATAAAQKKTKGP